MQLRFYIAGLTEGDTTISLADQINKENANTRKPTSEEENAALSLLPPRSKRARIAVADPPSRTTASTPTASTPTSTPSSVQSGTQSSTGDHHRGEGQRLGHAGAV